MDENPDFKKDFPLINKGNRFEVLSFCLYIIDKNSFALTIENLRHIEWLLHHDSVEDYNNKKDLSYFARRNWKLKE